MESKKVAVVTGVAAYPTILAACRRIEALFPGIETEVFEIKNNFFGESITVSGLLTGKDIFEQLAGRVNADLLLLPSSAVRREEKDFLCGMTVSELEKNLGVKIKLAGSDGCEFVRAVLGK